MKLLTKNKNIVFFFSVTLVMAAMVWYGTNSKISYTPNYRESVSFPVGKVIEVTSDQTETDDYGLRRGRQELRVKLLSGTRRGDTVDVVNTLTVDHSAYAKTGMRIVVYFDQQPGDDYYFASVQNYERSRIIYAIIALFFFLLAAVGGKTGIRSAFGLVFTFVVIIFFLIPSIINGAPPTPLTLAMIVCIIAVSLVSTLGFTKKACAGMIGTVVGVALCGVFYALISGALRISGYNVPEIDSLIVIAYNTNIRVGELLFCGILITSLGAATDVSVSVASSVAELSGTNAEATFQGLFRSGMRIGRDIAGAMSGTLILAFTGSFFTTLILLRIYEVQYNHLINMDEIAIEILQAAASSSALILCAPITACIASRLFCARPKHRRRSGIFAGDRA